jgi:two-component system nitrate/nitrite response regulator NarL
VAVRCLIVDDNEEFLDSATRLLSAQGIEVVGRASSGAVAESLVDELAPDVALVDVQLGNEDGLEVARRLVSDEGGTRVVLISTHAENELSDLVAASGAVGFLPKTALSANAIENFLR